MTKDGDKPDDAPDPKEYFGYKRDLESLCEFMGRWLSEHGRWGSPIFIAGESYGGYRVGRLVRMLQEAAGHRPERRDPHLACARDHGARSDRLRRPRLDRPRADDGRGRIAPRALARVSQGHVAREGAARGRGIRDRRLRGVPHARRVAAREGARRGSSTRLADLARPVRRRGRSAPRDAIRILRLRTRAPARRAQGARPLRRDDHGDRPVPRPRGLRLARIRRSRGSAPRTRWRSTGCCARRSASRPIASTRCSSYEVNNAWKNDAQQHASRRRPARRTTSATGWRSTRT